MFNLENRYSKFVLVTNIEIRKSIKIRFEFLNEFNNFYLKKTKKKMMYFETEETDVFTNEILINNPNVLTSYEYPEMNDESLDYFYYLIPNDAYSPIENNPSAYDVKLFDTFINNDDYIVEGEISKNVIDKEETIVKNELKDNDESDVLKKEINEACKDDKCIRDEVSKNVNIEIEDEVKTLKRKLEDCYEVIDQKNKYIKGLKDEHKQKDDEIRKLKREVYQKDKESLYRIKTIDKLSNSINIKDDVIRRLLKNRDETFERNEKYKSDSIFFNNENMKLKDEIFFLKEK